MPLLWPLHFRSVCEKPEACCPPFPSRQWSRPYCCGWSLNTLRPRQHGSHFIDNIFKWILFNENAWILIKISLKFVPKGPNNNNLALFQILACRLGNKSLSEPMMVSLLMHAYMCHSASMSYLLRLQDILQDLVGPFQKCWLISLKLKLTRETCQECCLTWTYPCIRRMRGTVLPLSHPSLTTLWLMTACHITCSHNFT